MYHGENKLCSFLFCISIEDTQKQRLKYKVNVVFFVYFNFGRALNKSKGTSTYDESKYHEATLEL